MSAGAQMARTPPRLPPKKRRGETYFTRPEDERKNSGVPRHGSKVQHAMITSDVIVTKALLYQLPGQNTVNTRTGAPRGRLVKHARIALVSEATRFYTASATDKQPGHPMPRRTVAHALERLQAKGIIERWDQLQAKSSPHGTHWHVLRWDVILDAWGASADVFTYGANNHGFFVQGKELRLLKAADVDRWGLNLAAAEQLPAAQAREAAEIEEPADTARAGAEEQDPKQKTQRPDDAALLPILHALIDACGGADERDTSKTWWIVSKKCGLRAIPEPEAIADLVREIAIERRKITDRPITVRLMQDKIPGRVEAWHLRIRQAEKQVAQQQRWARDERINRLIAAMKTVDAPARPGEDAIDADYRAACEELIRAADPGDLAEARRGKAQQATRAG